MGKALTIRARREPGYVVVTVAGEVDIATVAQLRERLAALAVSGVPLVANLDQVSFIDATGLGALAGAAREAPSTGPACTWSAPSPRPGGCSGSPGWTVRYPWLTTWPRCSGPSGWAGMPSLRDPTARRTLGRTVGLRWPVGHPRGDLGA